MKKHHTSKQIELNEKQQQHYQVSEYD